MLTDRERKIVYRAAEKVERGVERYACWALADAEKEVTGIDYGYTCETELARKYSEFCGVSQWIAWFDLGDSRDFQRETRVLALLTFAELG